MMRRPAFPSEWKPEQRSSTSTRDLDKDLSEAVKQSVANVASKVDALVKEKITILTDRSA
jgi:hypothetical protein